MQERHSASAVLKRWAVLLAAALGAGSAFATVDFTLTSLDGETHTLSDYRGKWVVVNYWATWCPPCREEMPELTLFHEKHKDERAVVLGVNMEALPESQLREFVEEYFVGFPILLSTPDTPALGPVPGLPTTYLVNPEGEVVGRHFGMITADDIEAFIFGHQR